MFHFILRFSDIDCTIMSDDGQDLALTSWEQRKGGDISARIRYKKAQRNYWFLYSFVFRLFVFERLFWSEGLAI